MTEKTCEYCGKVGQMPTFRGGDTCCIKCLKTFAYGSTETRRREHTLRSRIAELEALLQQHQTYQTKQGDKEVPRGKVRFNFVEDNSQPWPYEPMSIFKCTSDEDLSGDYYPAVEVERLAEASKGALHFVPFLSGYYKELEAALAAMEGK